jgi:uncharacterized protein (TIGR02594 family)
MKVGIILLDNMTVVGDIEIGDDVDMGGELPEGGIFGDGPIGGRQFGVDAGDHGGRRHPGRGDVHPERGRPWHRHAPMRRMPHRAHDPSERRPLHERHSLLRERRPLEEDAFTKAAREGKPAAPHLEEQAALPKGAQGAGVSSEAKAETLPTQKPAKPGDKGPPPMTTTAGGSAFLQRQRASRMAEIRNDPATKKLTHQMLATETNRLDPKESAATLEALVNRSVMTGNTIKQELNSGFYGPIKHGVAQRRTLSGAERQRADRAINEVAAGSNLIRGRTDQGSGTDPNVRGPGRVPVEGTSEVFNYWKGRRGGRDFSHADSQKFSEDVARGVAGGGTADGNYSAVAAHDMPRGFGPTGKSMAADIPVAKTRIGQLGSGVPNDIIARARSVAQSGGPGAVSEFMRAQGHPKDGNWCGEFAAAVVHSVGGQTPLHPEVASNWRRWGAATNTPQTGDVAVRRGAQTGSTGSHVTFVESINADKGTFVGLGGNQHQWRSVYPLSRFDFRRGNTTKAEK